MRSQPSPYTYLTTRTAKNLYFLWHIAMPIAIYRLLFNWHLLSACHCINIIMMCFISVLIHVCHLSKVTIFICQLYNYLFATFYLWIHKLLPKMLQINQFFWHTINTTAIIRESKFLWKIKKEKWLMFKCFKSKWISVKVKHRWIV